MTTPYTISSATVGSTYTIAANSPVTVVSGQSQYVYSNWSDSGAQSHTYTVSTAATVTASFTEQFYFTVTSTYGSPTGQGWYNTGSSVSSTISSGSATFNGIWLSQADLTTSMLEQCVANGIFNVFLNTGYPNPSEYPSLTGIVPSAECGLVFGKSTVASDLALLASVDSRLKLWAWFGTFSSGDDATGHANAKVDISTAANRDAIISVLTSIAKSWGFYGVQDDTEDFTSNCLTGNGQWGSWQVDYFNAGAIAAHNVGLKFAPFVAPYWYNFNLIYLSQLTGMDYLVMAAMVPSGGTTQLDWTTQVTEFLDNTNLPVIIDLENDISGDVTTQISWVNALPSSSYSNLVGFALYNWKSMDTPDWASWNIWATHLPPTTGWTGTGSLTSGGTVGSSTTGSFIITAYSTCVWNWQ